MFIDNDKFPIGYVYDVVVNPRDGVFAALWIKTPGGLKIMALEDIKLWTENDVRITSFEALVDADDMPRLAKILDREIPIIGNRVWCEKKVLGRVKNFAFDTISPRLLSLIVQSGWWLFGKKRIIPRTRIQKITKDGIYISNNLLKTPAEVRKGKNLPVPEPKTD